ncbi:unnamed protein product, partial [Staurois parvus]
MLAGHRTKHSGQNIHEKNDIFLKFSNFPPLVAPVCPTSQGPEHRSRMPALAGGDGRGCCRRHISGAKDKVSSAGTPYAAPHGKPECSSGLPLLVLT